jgi:DNA-binding HxlR family transcriptional regulator
MLRLFDDANLYTFAIEYIVLYFCIALTFCIVRENDMNKPEVDFIIEHERNTESCTRALIPVRDALEVLNGKWKLQIIISLTFGTKRFKEIAREVNGITDKMLSKELRALEENMLVKRTVKDSFPPSVEYTLTEHGKTLQKVIGELREWGVMHREKVMG